LQPAERSTVTRLGTVGVDEDVDVAVGVDLAEGEDEAQAEQMRHHRLHLLLRHPLEWLESVCFDRM
jgi:hypothetical protein